MLRSLQGRLHFKFRHYIPSPSLALDYFYSMEITFLGTGTSHGVPSLDCQISGHVRCKKSVCRLAATDPRHARTRSSILVEKNGQCILVDVSLDFRQQALRERIPRIDAVLVTHGHADHIGGIPDLRSYTPAEGEPLPLYGSDETVRIIRSAYQYVFDPNTFVGGGIPRVQTQVVDAAFELCGIRVVPLRVGHGRLGGCFGYRIDNLVYIPDMKIIDEKELRKCVGAETLVLNCLRDEREHNTHLILPQSMELARRIGPQQCYFIHMCHDIHYEIDGKRLDPWMQFSHDGLRVNAGG